MEPLNIPSNEHGIVRVFAINRAPDEISREIDAAGGKHPVAAALLDRDLPENGYELFPTSDLAGVGLAGYLSQGYDVPNDQLNRARGKLDALDGYVLLLFSSAFEGKQTTLEPGRDVTLIGTFGEAQPDMRTTPMESDAAQPYTGVPRQTPPTPPQGRAGGSLVVIGLLVLIALIVIWVLL